MSEYKHLFYSLDYAFATSDNANKYNEGNACWYVRTVNAGGGTTNKVWEVFPVTKEGEKDARALCEEMAKSYPMWPSSKSRLEPL